MTDENELLARQLRRAITRRQFGRGAVSAAMFAAISSQAMRPEEAHAEELTGPVNVLAWEGYDDPEIVKGFEEKYGVKLNVKTASSNANQLDQIRAGAIQFDVVNPDTVWIEKFAQSGFILALDRNDFPNLENLYEPFRNCDECLVDGQLYGVLTRWGMNGIVHWRDKISEADASDANVLWDPKLKERISIVDWAELYLWMTGLWLGYEHPEQATGADLDKIVARLIEVKPNLRAIHSETGACRTDLVNLDAWAIWGASSEQASIAMKVEGYDVALTIPKQGGAMWTESLQIVKGTQHLAAAKAYLNYMTSPEALVKFAWGRQKIMVTNSKVAELLTPEQIKILNLDQVDQWANSLRLNRAPVDEEAWKKAWQQFKAA
ncbi:MAG TPA: extracellular solute-binding protein [Alphaproteobacteria bacterium]|nr:extracellular solute-binding protein [Alphaproteobacteria bacterium]